MSAKISFLIAFLCFTSAIFGTTGYKIVDLGVPDIKPKNHISGSTASSINDKGQICGTYETDNGPTAFFWDPITGFRDLGITGSRDCHINNNSVIVGIRSFYDDVAKTNKSTIFRWDAVNGSSDIVPPSTAYFWILDFNNLNNILYTTQDANMGCHIYVDFTPLDSIFSLKNSYCAAKMNDHGKIFGFGDVENGLSLRIFDLKTNKLEDVLLFKGSAYSLAGINNNEVAAGSFYAGHQTNYGFTWTNEEGIKLFEDFIPGTINDNGDMLPACCPKFTFLCKSNGELINLHDAGEFEFNLSIPWTSISNYCGINENGWIVGSGTRFGDLNSRALLLMPMEEKN